MSDQRSQLRGKGEGAVLQRVVERLVADTVAAAEQDAGLPVVERKGPHAVEPRGQISPPLAIAMEQDLGVRMVAREAVPQILEIAAQFGEVVDFAVEHDAQATIERPHGLATA